MKKKLEPTNASIKPTLDTTDTQKTELFENGEKPLVSCDMCGHNIIPRPKTDFFFI